MDGACFKAIKDIALAIGCKWRVKNEDAGIIDIDNEASKVIFDDENERFYAIRTNNNASFGAKELFRITCAQYTCAKLIDLDVDLETLKKFCDEVGAEWSEILEFVTSTTVMATNTGSNFNKIEDKETGETRENFDYNIPHVETW